MRLLIASLYFLLPAAVANMIPVIANAMNIIPKLAKPVDGGVKLGGEYVLGSNKTWRGFILGIVAAVIISYMQYFLWQFPGIRFVTVVDFSRVNPLLFGLAGGIGALGGDAIKSFLKRRLHIKSGQAWPVFDQLDFVAGFTFSVSPFTGFNIPIIITGCIATLILHPLTNLFAYLFNVKRVWW